MSMRTASKYSTLNAHNWSLIEINALLIPNAKPENVTAVHHDLYPSLMSQTGLYVVGKLISQP